VTIVQQPRRPWRQHLLVIAGYLLVSLVFTWPLPRLLQTHLPGSPDGDTGLYVWNLWVFQHELLDQRTLPYFTERIFAATGRANLSLHNYTAFANILALPLVRLLGVVATFNVVYILLTVLTAYAMYLLAMRLTSGAMGVSWLSGVLFAWSPILVTRGMGHFSLVAAAPLPVFVLLLLRLGETRSTRAAIGLGATVAWATACDVYYGVFCVMLATSYLIASSLRVIRSKAAITPIRQVVTRGVDLLTVSVAGLVVARLVTHGWQFTLMGQVVRVDTLYTPLLALTLLAMIRLFLHYRPQLRPVSRNQLLASLRVLASTGVVSALLMSPLLYAFSVRLLEGQMDRSAIFWRSSPPGIDAVALVTPNPNHPLATPALREWVAQLTRDGYLENVASIPLVALAVLLVAWLTGWRPLPITAAIAVGFGLLALGPFLRIAGVDTQIPAPWALFRYLPIVGLARSPSRFLIFAMVGISAMFAIALQALISRAPGAGRAVIAAVAVLLFAELWPMPRTVFSAEIPPFYQIVAADPGQIRVLELPFGIRDGTMAMGNFTSRTQFYQTAHGKPIIGGYLSRVSRRRMRENERDPVLSALIRLSEGKVLSPDRIEELRREWPSFLTRTDVGYVVVDAARASDELRSIAESGLQLELLAEHGALRLYHPVVPGR
jgi:uncharacterized membrane protein (DUF485 family)